MTTLERAARAAAACLMDAPVDEGFSLADVNGWTEDKAFEIARAVLMAVREPDGRALRKKVRETQSWLTAREAFTAMIDAILNDGEEE